MFIFVRTWDDPISTVLTLPSRFCAKIIGLYISICIHVKWLIWQSLLTALAKLICRHLQEMKVQLCAWISVTKCKAKIKCRCLNSKYPSFQEINFQTCAFMCTYALHSRTTTAGAHPPSLFQSNWQVFFRTNIVCKNLHSNTFTFRCKVLTPLSSDFSFLQRWKSQVVDTLKMCAIPMSSEDTYCFDSASKLVSTRGVFFLHLT